MVGRLISFAILCLLLSVSVSVANAGTSCKDDQNKNVDWFFIYKLPRGAQNKDKVRFPKGEEYVYVDSNTPSSAAYWTLSPKNIFQSDGAVANTIAPLTAAKKPTNLTYAVYNDQPPYHPEDKKTSNGHTKGLIMFDEETGVWLIHSVPKFPEMLHKGVYVYPQSGREFGQVMLCVTLPSSQLETIATHLRLQYPNIYDSYAPASVKKSHPSLNLLLARKFVRVAPWVLTATLKDVGHNAYISFAKHGRYNKDVYSGQVANSLHSNLLASTWRNGNGGKAPADCNDTYTVTNIEKLSFKLGKQEQIDVKNSEDHSKWAISSETAKGFVCVGTLNRMNSQYRRGGETLCFKNALLHKLLLRTVTDFEDCPIQA